MMANMCMRCVGESAVYWAPGLLWLRTQSWRLKRRQLSSDSETGQAIRPLRR